MGNLQIFYPKKINKFPFSNGKFKQDTEALNTENNLGKHLKKKFEDRFYNFLPLISTFCGTYGSIACKFLYLITNQEKDDQITKIVF